MRHERARELIVDRLVDRLEAAERAELDGHLAECAECAALARDQERLWVDLGEALTPEPSAEGLERLRMAVAAEVEPARGADRAAGRAERSRRSLLARAAAIVVLVGAGVLLGAGLQSLRDGGAAGGLGEDAAQRYLVLIHATSEPPEQSELVSTLMQGWIDSLSGNGILVASQSFGEGRPAWVGPQQGPPASSPPFFIVITASSLREAQQIAGTSPSLAWGGALEVRAMAAPQR